MTSADTEAMKALQELLDERQRYEGWMRALDERRANTPEHVFTRVQTDYSLRLERVMQRLSERTEQVRATVDAMRGKLTGLRSKESDRIDARQEAELRAAVGEYTDEEWTKLRDEADLEIELLAEERGGVETELAEMERILEMTQPAKPKPAAEASAPEPPTQTQSTQSQPAHGTASVSQQAPATAPATATPAARPFVPPTVATAPADEAPSIDDFVADWPVRHVDPSAVAQGDGIAEVPEVDQSPPAANTASAMSPRTAAFAPPLVGHTADGPSVDQRRDQEKTLKCPECGALNYATEWYCERCGGELATF
jgi:hypothetical protein